MTAQARRKAPLVALFAAEMVSLTGNMMTMVAIPWFVLQTTGSAVKTGIAGFFNFLPVVIASVLGGALIDRIGLRRTSILADLLSAASVILIPVLHWMDALSFPLLLGIVFLGALFDAPGGTARAALIPLAGRDAGWPAERSTGAHAVAERGARLLGAPIAGVLIAWFGAVNVLVVDTVTFVASALLVAAFVRQEKTEEPAEARPPYFREIADGFKALWGDHVIRMIVLTVALTNFIDAATSAVVLPVYADDVLSGAISLGIMIGAMAAGSVAGAALFAMFGERANRRFLYVIGFACVAAKFPVLATFPPFPVVVAAFAIAGLGAGPLNPIIGTVMIERIAPDKRGRVYSAVHGAAWMAMPLGVLVGGFLVEGIDLRATLVVMGAVYFLATGIMQRCASLRRLEESRNKQWTEDAPPPAEPKVVAGVTSGDSG